VAKADQAGDQQRGRRPLRLFDTATLDRPRKSGPPIVTLEVAPDRTDCHRRGSAVRRASDRRILRVLWRCSTSLIETDTRSLRRWRWDSVTGCEYSLTNVGTTFPAGHRIRLALSTAYWPMIWPAPEKATVTVFGARSICPYARLGLGRRRCGAAQAGNGNTEQLTTIRPGVVRIDRIGLELHSEGKSTMDIKGRLIRLAPFWECSAPNKAAGRLAGTAPNADADVVHRARRPTEDGGSCLGRQQAGGLSRVGLLHPRDLM